MLLEITLVNAVNSNEQNSCLPRYIYIQPSLSEKIKMKRFLVLVLYDLGYSVWYFMLQNTEIICTMTF